uniref:Uncharacterized protein n=1 Tax=Triticum urartu TaxID=4572 RepID=A0A8R7V385_TRIUA
MMHVTFIVVLAVNYMISGLSLQVDFSPSSVVDDFLLSIMEDTSSRLEGHLEKRAQGALLDATSAVS